MCFGRGISNQQNSNTDLTVLHVATMTYSAAKPHFNEQLNGSNGSNVW